MQQQKNVVDQNVVDLRATSFQPQARAAGQPPRRPAPRVAPGVLAAAAPGRPAADELAGRPHAGPMLMKNYQVMNK